VLAVKALGATRNDSRSESDQPVERTDIDVDKRGARQRTKGGLSEAWDGELEAACAAAMTRH